MPEAENTWNAQISIFECFLFWALLKVRDQIWKQLYDKVLYNYCSIFCGGFCPQKWRTKNGFSIGFSKSDIITVLKKNCESFCPNKWRSKKWTLIVFLKRDLGGGESFFQQNYFLKKPNTNVLVVTCPKLNSVTALLPTHIIELPCPCVVLRHWMQFFSRPLMDIGATICIGEEIQCLPYAGFFFRWFETISFWEPKMWD